MTNNEPAFPVEPVEHGPTQTRSLRAELYTFANVYTQKRVESVKMQSSVLSFRVNSIVFNKYHSLSREKKRIIRAILEKLIEELASSNGNSLNINTSVTNVNLNLNVNAQVVQQIVERAGVRELKEKLKKYESIVNCVRAVVYGNYVDKLELIKRCLQQ